MVRIRERIFLICGSNFLQRQIALENLKKRILKGLPPSVNTISFYSQDIDIKELKEKTATASFDGCKIIVFRNSEALKKDVREFLFKNITVIMDKCFIVLDTDREFYQLQKDKRIASDDFFRTIFKKGSVIRMVPGGRSLSIEDFRLSLRKNDIVSCLYIVDSIFEGTSRDKQFGPQILGMLTSKLSYMRNSSEKNKAFTYLWNADRLLKERGLDTRLVIETLLARLMRSRLL